MTTSDPAAFVAAPSIAAVSGESIPGASGIGAGLPSPQALTAWANELFRHGVSAFEALASSAPALPDEALPVESALPIEAFVGAAEPVLAPLISLLPVETGAAAPTLSAATAEAVASGATSAVESSSFYFLEHARQAATPAFLVPGSFDTGPFGLDRLPGAGAGAVSLPVAGLPTASSLDAALLRIEFPDVPTLQPSPGLFDVNRIRRDFPILSEKVNGRPLVWLDNAATTQKPRAVIDRISHFYEHENSNVHRGAHTLAARSTDAYEAARETVRRFLRASSSDEIVFVRGATEGINLVAQAWGHRNVREGDEIVISWLEHHSNIVPWQQLCSETGARLRVAPIDDSGQILLDEYERLLNGRTKIVALTQVSNALGTVTPLREMIAAAHRVGAKVLVDAAQSIPHLRTDVQTLDCDFLVFSGHKVFGPTGIGVVYGKAAELAAMPPWQGGGNMIADVTFDRTVYNPPPSRFEAGTGNIADAVGLGAALEYVEAIGLDVIARYEHDLLEYGTTRLLEIPGLRLVGTAKEKAAVLSFVLPGVPTPFVGQELARDGIAVRAGHHCAQPALRRLGLENSVRPSLAFYNTCRDIDALIDSLHRIHGGSARIYGV